MSVGVVIGRFQVAALHEGHVALLSAVAAKCTRLVVLIGVSPAPHNAHDPLPFFCRQDAIQAVFPQATVLPLYDQPTDGQWTDHINAILMPLAAQRPITLYGGRDSSVRHYGGPWPIEELPLESRISGTAIRQATDLGYSFEFRTGMVYAAAQRFPTSFQTVDIAVLRGYHVLAGRKTTDGGRWRFPGGFVDPADESLEAAAKRELREECGPIEVATPRYAGSVRVADWRYRASTDAILTAFYVMPYVFGAPKAGDDLGEVAWIPRDQLAHEIHLVHQPLVSLLRQYWETHDSEPVPAVRQL